MKIIILNESKAPDPLNNVEKRCAATPSSAQRLVKKGATLLLEAGAGVHSGYSDKEYEDVGVAVIDDVNDALSTADMLVAVNKPTDAQLALMKKGAIVVGHLDPFFQQPLIESIAEKGLTAISVEMIPRSSRAQKMDALSSQASLAGYVMVMQAANKLPSILPMMMTPSGTIKPAKVFIIGAGVAGLQAIATAKRLGANVLAYDTRPVVAEQVESLGGKFLKIDIGETGQTKDGYAKELTEEQKAKQQEAQRDAIADSDIVITTAQLFGRKPPVLISKDTLALMKPGSVVVDMAATSGGNVEGSVAGETVEVNGVKVIGNGNWSQYVAKAATDMYANNIYNLVDEFFDDETKTFGLNLEDDILAGCVITHDGNITNDMLINAYKGA
ncbi:MULTISPECIES: NAD(P) transhydrogenase subunit alpha [Alteromonas]|uniref:NAD(P) transhydrogenase subunit alpha n=1 Tax=Alteromonas TaxID=226 RepID=UPI000286F623|nr:NAD(P) transhydrogenase subunit alpha [Alteromonas macleodii]AFT80133.1 NAD(P) transhydrogenase subunit alpha [Alteromonas macleodii str. 'Black Sea 11']NKX36264.1 NAD(P) transhydrogenase subunit alpha [Alteromonadaceae bacterium A_SAG3]NKX68682.1 NAD(P) transhydrogenase subunit alpha [Alteromonadaceae bacterium A_SAG7]